MRAFLLGAVASAVKMGQTPEGNTWDMVEQMKNDQYTATTDFEMHRAETENLQDWRSMRTVHGCHSFSRVTWEEHSGSRQNSY